MFYRKILCPSKGETKINDCQKRSHTPNKLHGLRAMTLHDSLTIRSIKFRKVAKKDYERSHVCPPVHMEHVGPHHTGFCEVLD